jgi:ribosomal-protein-alanine N-acetyltransferase
LAAARERTVVSVASGGDCEDRDASAPDGVELREATREDLFDVLGIERAVFDQPWPYAAFEGFLGDRGFLVAVDDDGSVVGYVVADTVPNHGHDIGHVKDLAVVPDARGAGVGRALLERALVVLASDGVAVVKLEVRTGNEAALSLYRDRGFEPARRVPRYYDDGEDALVMVLDVGPDAPTDDGDDVDPGVGAGADVNG